MEKDLEKLRSEINKLDLVLFQTLKKRFKIVLKIASIKKKYKLPIIQKSRKKFIIENGILLGAKLNLNPVFISSLMKLIHKESIKIQTNKIIKKKA